MQLVGDNALAKWSELCGPADSVQAKIHAPSSIRSAFGTDSVKNAVHSASSPAQQKAEADLFFSRDCATSAYFTNCTCAIIKPHIVAEGLAGEVIDTILEEGYEISAMQMFTLDKPTAEEFLEVYKGVLPEFSAIAKHMTEGPCIVMEVRQENAVQSFRELCGPMDPEIAKNLRPKTLRAKYGVDRTMNAIHCTDLPEDGTLESEYFFSIQQQ